MTRAWGDGLSSASSGQVLDSWFPAPRLGDRPGSPPVLPSGSLERAIGVDPVREVRTDLVSVDIDTDDAVRSTADAYLRLHLLSHLLARPNEVNLAGLFEHLPIVAWTSAGPVAASDLNRLRPTLRAAGVQVTGLDRFPRLLDYVTPARVRIADAARVRLGAHLAPGTTVMHAGFVNYNAGTLGPAMVEGRISQGVVVGDGSDIGGGASIMGTLSGGGAHRVRIGARVLLGANSGVGISIGDDGMVEAGLYLTPGTKVTLLVSGAERRVVKASELSGVPALLFRRNSQSGAVEALPREVGGLALNPVLHA